MTLAVAAGGAGVSDHHLLSNLALDDHTQYVLVDGTRAMTGDIVLPAQTANEVMAGPVSGADAAPAFRPLVEADLPQTAGMVLFNQVFS